MTAERQALNKLLSDYPALDVWLIERRSDPLRLIVWLAAPEEHGVPMGAMLKFEIERGSGVTRPLE